MEKPKDTKHKQNWSCVLRDITYTLLAILLTLLLVTSAIKAAGLLVEPVKAGTPSQHVPAEYSYKPGMSRGIQYDYVTVNGNDFVLFKDISSGSISAVMVTRRY